MFLLVAVFLSASTQQSPEKKKMMLSLSDEAQWEDYFIQESTKAQELKARINATDQEIDRMVYHLYELTEEEIGIVEKI